MAWRVGGNGLRAIHADGSESVLPPGTLLDDLPDRYEGRLELVSWPREATYDDKAVLPPDYEVKG